MPKPASTDPLVELPGHELPVVAIVGRPNVGKSALFNQLLGRRVAIVHAESGVTRDRVSATVEWQGRRFLAIDTGGLGVGRHEKTAEPFAALIREQLAVAVASADRVILVVDVTAGLMAQDHEVALLLRDSGKPVVVAANKADNERLAEAALTEFAALGFPLVIPTSCTLGRNISELLQTVAGEFPEAVGDAATPALSIAFVGRQNVGKSSIVNRLLGEERMIVSDIPGTTRDAVDVPIRIRHEGRMSPAVLVDTAGIRRRGRIASAVELFSMKRTEEAIARADVVIVVLEAPGPIVEQDQRICRLVSDAGKACLLLVNKWDLATGKLKQQELLELLTDSLPFMDFAPVLCCCARSGYQFDRILPTVLQIARQLNLSIPTALVNRVVSDIVARYPPPTTAHGALKVYYGCFTHGRPPTFLLFCNDRARAPEHYLRFLGKQLRQAFELAGQPVRIILRNREREDSLPRSRPGGSRRTRPHAPGPRRGRKGAAR